MADSMSYDVFFSIIQKANNILTQFFDKVYNIHQQIKDNGNSNEILAKHAKTIGYFKEYLLDNNNKIFSITFDADDHKVFIDTINEYLTDEKNLVKEDLMKKYDLKDGESFNIPHIDYAKSKDYVMTMVRDIDMNNVKSLLKYIDTKSNNKLKHNMIERNSIEKLNDSPEAEKCELIFDNERLKNIITHEMQAMGIEFQVNNHEDNISVIYNRYGKMNGSDEIKNIEDWTLNMIDKNEHLNPRERATIICKNSHYIDNRENSVKEFKKAVSVER